MLKKNYFLLWLIFLLPLQATWASVANYDTQGAHDSSTHFGHHEHQPIDKYDADFDLANFDTDQDNTLDIGTDSFKTHAHYGFNHFSCGVGLSQRLPVFAPENNQYTSPYLFNYHSPPSNTLDRPNWITPV